jgi:hypothetical protein
VLLRCGNGCPRPRAAAALRCQPAAWKWQERGHAAGWLGGQSQCRAAAMPECGQGPEAARACWQDKDTCWPVHTPIRYYVEAYGQVGKPGPDAELEMMNEIYQRGPITCR